VQRFSLLAVGLWLGLVVASQVFAASVDGLYEVRIPVATQAEAEREGAVKQAMATVLVRVTGNRQIETVPAGAKIVGLAGRFLRQYRYESMPVGKTVEGVSPLPTQLLYAQFDEAALNEAIWREKLTVWGKTRPSLLVWLVTQDVDRHVAFEDRADSMLGQALRDQARNRGVPLLIPTFDAADQAKVSIEDVWNGVVERIRQASVRYPTEAILAGQVAQMPDGSWAGRWVYMLGEEVKTWDLHAPDANALAKAALDAASDEIAARYAPSVVSGEAAEVVIRVADVRNVDDYARTQRYLASLPGVSSVQVVKVEATRLLLRVDLRSGKAAFEQAIALGGQLGPDRLDPNLDPAASLVYRLLP